MTTATVTQATSQEVTHHNTVKTQGIQVANTKNGDVVFVNTEYVSQKLINILTTILNSDEYTLSTGENYGTGVFAVVFRIDGMPKLANDDGTFEDVPWLWYEGCKTIVCNIKRCVDIAFEQTLSEAKEHKDSECMYIPALIWQHLLAGFLHECHHAETFMDDAMKMLTDKKAMLSEEVEADEFACMELYELAKTIDIEMDLGPVINTMYDERWQLIKTDFENTPENKLTVKELMFMEYQDYMRQNGGLWYSPPEDGDTEHDPKICHNFKELMHFISGDAIDDESWNMPIKQNHVETVVVDNTPSLEDAQGNVVLEDGQGNVVNEMPPAQGFQGAMPQAPMQQPQQNMGYPPAQQQQFVPQTPAQQNMGYQQEETPQYNGNPNAIAANAPGMPVPPAGALGQPYQQPNNEVVVGAPEFPATALDVNSFQQVVAGLYYKIFDQVFNACGFNPMNGPGQPFFMQGAKIVEPIMLSEEEKKIVHFMECYDENGKFKANVPVGDWISGKFINKDNTLPGYVLTMSNMQGQRIVRKFIPQNPWKTNASGGYSQTAQLAQQGTKVMWIIDPAEKDKQYATRILNGQLQSNRANNEWQNIC